MLALDHGGGDLPRVHGQLHAVHEQGIGVLFLFFLVLLLLVGGVRAVQRLDDALVVARGGLFLDEVDQVHDLVVADEGALHADGLARAAGVKEHVAAAQELFRPADAQDRPAVDLRGHGKGDARGHVCLD